MNPKINKLKAEREKNSKKIAALQQRNREIDDSIHELENLDIVGMVRSCGMTPELLRIYLRQTLAEYDEISGVFRQLMEGWDG